MAKARDCIASLCESHCMLIAVLIPRLARASSAARIGPHCQKAGRCDAKNMNSPDSPERIIDLADAVVYSHVQYGCSHVR